MISMDRGKIAHINEIITKMSRRVFLCRSLELRNHFLVEPNVDVCRKYVEHNARLVELERVLGRRIFYRLRCWLRRGSGGRRE